ncbi:MAG: hypothetical protein ACKOWM_07285, partial [Sphingomonadales bacterium]
SQHDQLIYGSVIDNIQMGRHFTTEQIIELAEAVGLATLVLSLTDSYRTVLNPEASTLDRKLKTLILLCRALIDQPAVLLWDVQMHYLPHAQLQHVLTYCDQHFKGTLLLASVQDHSLELNHEKLILC